MFAFLVQSTRPPNIWPRAKRKSDNNNHNKHNNHNNNSNSNTSNGNSNSNSNSNTHKVCKLNDHPSESCHTYQMEPGIDNRCDNSVPGGSTKTVP